jgi:hypothetical protein
MAYELVRYLHNFTATLNISQASMDKVVNNKVLGINWGSIDVFSIDQW